MAGTAQAADLIRCDRCTGHYVVDAASDGSPRVRCNQCGHVREVTVPPAPASVPGKWTVIGPDGKAMSFDTWEELTESRRPSAIAPTAKAMEEANSTLKDLKTEKKSASALLDIGPAPKLALADMDSAIDLGEPMGRPRSRPSGKLEPLLVKSFSQAPAQNTPKVEWAPKVDKSSLPPRVDDNTMRVEVAPSAIAASKPSERSLKKDDSLDELDPDSLVDDDDEEEAAPLSLRDAIPDDEEELGEDDLEEPEPHEKTSLGSLVVAKPASQAPPPKTSQAPAPRSVAPPPKRSAAPPAISASQAPPPRPKSLSRPDVRADEPQMSLPPPTINPVADPEPKPSERKTDPPKARASARSQVAKAEEKQPDRTWMWAALGAVLLIGVGWRLTLSSEPTPPEPKPQPTLAPPTPVVTPATAATYETPPVASSAAPTASVAIDLPPVPSANPTVATNTPPVNANPNPTPNPNVTPAEKPVSDAPPVTSAQKPTVAAVESGSMSELLDKAGAAKRKGDLATAKDLYTKVIGMSPTNVEANGGLGDIAKAQGDLPGAKAAYERALAASPAYSPALLGLADVEWDSGNQAEAKRRYGQIVDRMGDRAPERAKERSQ